MLPPLRDATVRLPSRRDRWFLGTALTILVLDLTTKAWILRTLPYRDGFPVIPGFFNIVHARNTGMAFGLLRDAPTTVTIPFFVVVGLAALLFLGRLARRLPTNRRLIPAILGAIAGGAVGNVLDRIRFGYVVDFLDFYVGRYHWPAFNVADIGISVGTTLLVVLSLLGRDDGLLHATEEREQEE